MDNGTVVAQIAELLRQRGGTVGRTAIGQDRIADLALDSIDLVYILSKYERDHDADFIDTDYDLEQYETVADLATTIVQRINV